MTDAGALAGQLSDWAADFENRGASFGMGLDIVVFLLALRIDHERTQPPYNANPVADPSHDWTTIKDASGSKLVAKINQCRTALSETDTLLGLLARLPEIPDEPAQLSALIGKIDRSEQLVGAPWTASGHVLADAFDQVLVQAGNAENISLLPTHRDLAAALATVLNPATDDTIVDPAAGSGGLLLAAKRHCTSGRMNRLELQRLRDEVFSARELRPDTARWGAFNLFLHGVGTLEAPPLVDIGDSLARPQPAVASVVVTNPEFGRQEAGLAAKITEGSRTDIAVTGNRQLDMLQHVMSMLKPGGRAAMILPDNVLFEGGQGAAVRKRLLDTCDLHTILRLPTGLSRKGGVKTNVLFFDKHPAREDPWTTETWIYDLRTNLHFTLVRNPLTGADLEPFTAAYSPGDHAARVESDRFRCFSYEDLTSRDQLNLDIRWMRDDDYVDVSDLPGPDVLARELADELTVTAALLAELADQLDTASGDYL